MASLRTERTESRYQKLLQAGHLEQQCRLCDGILVKEFKYWKVIQNRFPYDLIADVHHMIIPKRHVKEIDLTMEERKEYEEIKRNYIDRKYQYILEATNKSKSIAEHLHLHLIISKKKVNQ